SITLRIPLFQAKEMTLPQQNTASARPTSFYYLMCQLDRVQYQILQLFLLMIDHYLGKRYIPRTKHQQREN
ncbi:hypothetical protein, partial [Lentilactobacillus parafarraginis]|uniref:hypothetical protein n=1 Tax=Lentilactobacillus parafarraginis TaxID=390842 RepID=UPI001CDCF3E0